jgi:uncharacterized cupredoxin-like copper-binding protein
MRLLSLVAVLVVALVGATTASARASAAQTATVRVTAKDFKFVLSTKTVRHGRIVFVIRNVGHAAHDFAIAGHRSRTIGPGRATRLTLTLKRGRYPYRCTVDDHTELGMRGVLRVT